MRPLTLQEYSQNFDSWSESTRNSYVSRLCDFGDHNDIAWHVNAIYNESAASKLVNMALDAGVRFDKDDIFLMEFSINEATLNRVKETQDNWAWKRKQKKQKKDAFWSGVAQTEFFDTWIDEIIKKK